MNQLPCKALAFWHAFIIYLSILPSFLSLQARAQSEIAGTRDGVNMILKLVDPLEKIAPEFICGLENTTKNPVPYLLNAAGPAISFRLFSSDGSLISEEESWSRQSDPEKSLSLHNGWYDSLQPGEKKILMRLKLNEMFGSRWHDGARLESRWNPGQGSGAAGAGIYSGPFAVGDGLTGAIDLTPLTGKRLLSSVTIPEHPQDKSVPFRDGLVLSIRVADANDPTNPVLSCEVENTRDEPVPFCENGPGARYFFVLRGHNGNEIKPNAEWYDAVNPLNADSRPQTESFIPPGGKTVYQLHLRNAYGSSWTEGVNLRVNWGPGSPPNSKGKKAYSRGYGLVAYFNITELAKRSRFIPSIKSAKISASSEKPLPKSLHTLEAIYLYRWTWIILVPIFIGLVVLYNKKVRRTYPKT